MVNNTTICETLTLDAIESLGKGDVIILKDLEDFLL
jgi:flagellar motor switch protein FliM